MQQNLVTDSTGHHLICSLREDEWTFVEGKTNLLTEFHLYCDRMYIISAGTTIYFLGFLAAVSVLCSYVDLEGRKFTTQLFIFLYTVTLAFHILSTSVFQLLVGRFILGALHGGISISIHVLFFETASRDLATFMALMSGAGFSIGGGLVGLVAMESATWQSTMIPPIIAWVVLGTAFYHIVPESPHWLFAKGKEAEALLSLNKIGSFNNRAPLLENVKLISATENESSNKKVSFSVLWEVKFLRTSLLSLSFVWFTVSLCYYGLEFNAGSFGNEYIVMIVMGFFDTPFKMYLYRFANRKGRQMACQTYLGCALFCMLCTGVPFTHNLFIAGNLNIQTVLVACGRALAGSVFAMLYVYTTEILPTLVRSVGISFCSTVARVGSVMSPFVILVNDISPVIIYMTIIVCLVVSMRLLRNIPETVGKPLPNTLQDSRKLFGLTKPGSIV